MNINPDYYKNNKLQVIDVINEFELDFYQGTIIQYVIRCGKKTPSKLEDLRKAQWYIEKYIEQNEVPKNQATLAPTHPQDTQVTVPQVVEDMMNETDKVNQNG